MKIIVIGATHAGTFATQQILTDHPDANVTVYERNNNLSFLSCGIALWVGDHVSDPNKMFYSSPEALAKLGANMQMEHDVLSVDPDAKTVEVKDLNTGEVTTDTYDKLVYTTGSTPIVPNIPGIHDTDVHLCKNWQDAKTLKDLAPTIKSAIVIGAGYIGAELAEQYAVTDKQVTLIDGLPRVLAKNFDATITDRVEKLYTDHGVHLALGEMVTSFAKNDQGETVVTTDKVPILPTLRFCAPASGQTPTCLRIISIPCKMAPSSPTPTCKPVIQLFLPLVTLQLCIIIQLASMTIFPWQPMLFARHSGRQKHCGTNREVPRHTGKFGG